MPSGHCSPQLLLPKQLQLFGKVTLPWSNWRSYSFCPPQALSFSPGQQSCAWAFLQHLCSDLSVSGALPHSGLSSFSFSLWVKSPGKRVKISLQDKTVSISFLPLDGKRPKGFNASLVALVDSENRGRKLPKLLLLGWVVPGFRA